MSARNQVAVVGYAHSPVVRHSELTLGEIAVQTARAAIADAGLHDKDIDGFVTGTLLPTAGAHQAEDGVSIVSADWLAAALGVEPRHTQGFMGNGQIPGSVSLAVEAITSGKADYVVMHRALHNPKKGSYHGNPMTQVRGGMQWSATQGYFGPLAMIALPYNEYLQRYGATREAMAAVVVEARKNGSRIPWSYWYDQPLTVEEYLSAPQINDPICRFDCDIPVDGVASFVFTSAERARDLPNKPVYVSGYALSSPPKPRTPLHWPLDDIMGSGFGTASRLWENAGVSPSEVDLPQLYDGFSPFIWFWMEVLGLCAPGEAHQLTSSGGIDSDRPGALPVLSSGGALGNGRMHGIPQMLEVYLQLSGRADDRQREGATVGLAAHSSPHFGGAVVYSAEAF